MTGKRKNVKQMGAPCRKNRHGIPVFDSDENLKTLFKQHERDDHDNLKPPMEAGKPSISKKAGPACLKDKHGLPVLDGRKSLSKMLMATEPEPDPETETFSQLLDLSLKGKGQDALLKAKRERKAPEPVPLKKRLKRYPKPEKKLDLHGFHADKAKIVAESWLRTTWRNGGFTVRIIVGRGLHSEFGAVLPDVIEELIVRLKQEGVVLWFEWDRKRKSQSGSVIVYLKQFD